MANLIKVSYGGAMPTGEEWSVNPVFMLGDGSTPIEVNQTMIQAVATAIAAITLPAALVNTFNGNSNAGVVRCEARKRTGELEVLAEATKATPTPGSGAQAHPFQTAIVCSLRTTTPGGRGRGRLYWNATGQAINTSDLRVASATTTSIVAGFKTFLSGMSAAIVTPVGGSAPLAVWSRLNSTLAPVTELRVGNVLDTQRRRRDALTEAFSTTTYP